MSIQAKSAGTQAEKWTGLERAAIIKKNRDLDEYSSVNGTINLKWNDKKVWMNYVSICGIIIFNNIYNCYDHCSWHKSNEVKSSKLTTSDRRLPETPVTFNDSYSAKKTAFSNIPTIETVTLVTL